MRNLTLLIGAFALLTSMGMAATLTVVHGLPGDSIGLPRELPVDVYVNQSYEAPAFTFEFTNSVDNLDLAAGDYTFEVFVTGSDPNASDPVLSLEATLVDGRSYTAIAHLTYTGDADAPGIALSAFQNETSFISASPPNGRITVRHAANAPTVDLEIRRAAFWPFVIMPGFSNTDGEGPEERVVDMLRGPFFVNLLVAGNQVFSTGRLDLAQGDNIIAYAIGDFFTDSFQLFLQVID
jgi:hypothetical protein